MQTTCPDYIRPIDQMVLDLLRQGHGLTVHELTVELDVTPTAVRQRLDRLVDAGLIERLKESVGRGRPVFRYVLTNLGMRYASASYSELAMALWQEVMELPNPQQRGRILRRVAKRMALSLKKQLPESGGLHDRLAAMVVELGKRKVPAGVNASGELPILEVYACPYPDLTDEDESRRHLCEMEEEMLSQAMGQTIHLDSCRLDGHVHCKFKPMQSATEPVRLDEVSTDAR